MELTRRAAIGLCTVGGVALATGTLSGCTVSKADVIEYANDVVDVADQVASAIQPTFPTIAAQIRTATTDLSSVIAAYSGGTDTVTSILAALSDVATLVGTITGSGTITTIITVALAACTVAYNAIKQLESKTTTATSVRAQAKMSTISTRWDSQERKACPHRFGRSPKGDIRAAWNKVVDQNPEYGLKEL